MIIYIHGFGSSGYSAKVKLLREYFKGINVDFIAPSLSYIPELAIQTLEELIESYSGNVKLMGSSLGGYYSIYLSQKYNLQAILINPSISPYQTLSKVLGDAPSYYDESSFKWMPSHIEMLKQYDTTSVEPKNFMLVVQTGDELLDYKKAVSKFDGAIVIVEEGGSHGFDGIDKYFEEFREFFN